MAGSVFGNILKCTTWGESHGPALGAVLDGCPAGLAIDEDYIQMFMDRRKPGQSDFSTKRNESDKVMILSGVFEGKTTGTPISLMINNNSQISKDYSNIAECYRPGHADYTFDEKYGFRDYRGGGRSSGRETAGRVAAGAIAIKLLGEFGINFTTFVESVGDISIDYNKFDKNEISNNKLYMPDKDAAEKAAEYLKNVSADKDSSGAVVKCIKGSENNDEFYIDNGEVRKRTNNSGGILGGISDGSSIILTAAFKPTPSIYKSQKTVNNKHEDIELEIKGRHDPIIAPRAVVVVEAMSALVIADALLMNCSSKLDNVKKIYDV